MALLLVPCDLPHNQRPALGQVVASRFNIKDDMMQEEWTEGIDGVRVLRINKHSEEKENLDSPLKAVSSPTLMEFKEIPSCFIEDIQRMKAQLLCLMHTKLIVDASECVNRLGQLLTCMLVDLMGRKLQHVPDNVRKLLLGKNGPFAGRKKQKKTCGTYLELMQHQLKHANAKFEEYLQIVEFMIIKKFNHIPAFPKEPEGLRVLFQIFVQTARDLRDTQSHIGLLPHGAKEDALQLIEENFGSLKDDDLQPIVPLVRAGVYILRHGIPYNVEDNADDEVDKEEDLPSVPIRERLDVIIPPQQTYVKVTFFAKKKLKLGHAVSVFGYHSLLGKGLPDRAIQMCCEDGWTWSKVIKLPIDVDIRYSFIIVERRKAFKWEMIDGPFGDFVVHVGASPMTVETNLEDYKDGEE